MKLAKQKARQRKLNPKSRQGKDGKTRDHRKAKRYGGRGYRSARVSLAKECQTLREYEIGFLHWLTAKIIKDHRNLCPDSKTYCRVIGSSQKREDHPYCRFI